MKPGTKVRVVHMADPWPLAPGTVGIVEGIDSLGDYLVTWSNGSILKLIEGIDQWEVLDEKDTLLSSLPTAPHLCGGGD